MAKIKIKSFCKKNDFSDSIKRFSPQEITNAFLKIDDYLCAVFLSKVHANYSSSIIENFPEERMTKILSIIAKGITATDEIFRAVEKYVCSEIIIQTKSQIKMTAGINTTVKILNLVKPATLRTAIKKIGETDSGLSEEIKKELFLFEDIVVLSDKDIQKVLREVTSSELAFALKNTSDEVREKIYQNMEKEAAETLKEDIDYMGPRRLKDVDQMQAKILSIIRRLAEEGVIIISKNDDQLCY